MTVPIPHYLLYSQTRREDGLGRWRFALRASDGSKLFEAADTEPTVSGERLDLLTVVRALESLDRPSRVTLVGCSRSIRQGIEYGLPQWRSNGWRWEFYGQMVPVKNGDLWQRLDRAQRFHRVECGRQISPVAGPIRTEPSVRDLPLDETFNSTAARIAAYRWVIYRLYRLFPATARYRRRIAAMSRVWRRRAVRSWSALSCGGGAGYRYLQSGLQGGACANYRCVGEDWPTDRRKT